MIKIDKEFKTSATSAFKDIVSPLPILDDAFVYGFNEISKKIKENSLEQDIQDEIARAERLAGMEGKEISDYDRDKIREQIIQEQTFQLWDFDDDSYGKSFGTIGIGIDKYNDLMESRMMANDGYFENNKGEPMFLVEEDQELAKDNYSIGRLYTMGLLPADAGSVARYASKRIKERALTSNQFVEYKEYNDIINQLNKDRSEEEKIQPITREERIMVSRGDGSFEDVLKKTRGELNLIDIDIEKGQGS